MENKHGHIEQNRARIWQIGLFSLNNTSTNLFLAMMGYVSYYANGIAGLSVVLISVIPVSYTHLTLPTILLV